MAHSRSLAGAEPVQMGSRTHSVSDTGSFLLTVARFPGATILEPHVHERTTFALILEGGFDLRFTSAAIRRRALPCPPGTTFTEPAGEKHANHLFAGGARVLVIQPHPDAGVNAACGAVLDRISHFRHAEVEQLGRRLAREVGRRDDLSLLSAEALALGMLVEAARLEPRRRHAPPDPAWLRRVVELVHDRFRERLTVTEVAAEAGVEPARLATAFRAAHGVPLGTYVRRLRVAWVAERLVDGDEPIALLALRAGFADQAHLTRTFRQATGWTPGRYRRRRRPD
ncbi:MAG: AraC family transcriptional regulator [Gemmatimonadota bacterium]